MSNKPLPTFETDDEAEDFIASADLTQYDLSGATPSRYEFLPATTDVSIRMPQSLLDALKTEARCEGVSYRHFILQALERALEG